MPNLFIDQDGAHPLDVEPNPAALVPVNASDLAAYVYDLLDARGLSPVLTPETRVAAEHAAALMLAAFGALPDPAGQRS